jgi:integrase
MARAVVWKDSRGRLNVIGRGVIGGQRYWRRLIIPKNDEVLAKEFARALNLRFALGDLSWLLQARGARAKSRKTKAPATLGGWAPQWLEGYRPPVVGPRTWYNYSLHVRDLVKRLGGRTLPRVLRMIFRDGRIRGLVESSPFDAPLPRRRTKKEGGQGVRKVHFRPFTAAELQALLDVLRAPKTEREAVYYPATEMMLLTGLRWGEAIGILWDDISWVAERVNIRRAVVRGFDDIDEPTKTGAKWVIRMTEPLYRLLQVQKPRTYLGRLDGRVFPGVRGGVMSYSEWRKRGWLTPIRRAKVSPREGDAQKALRRSFITSALVCGRNPKQVSEAIGHKTTRMVTDVYDSFLGEDAWADDAEVPRLQGIYGWVRKGRTREEAGR